MKIGDAFRLLECNHIMCMYIYIIEYGYFFGDFRLDCKDAFRDVHTTHVQRQSQSYLYNTTHNIIILTRRRQRSIHRITRYYMMTKPISTILYGAGVYEHII